MVMLSEVRRMGKGGRPRGNADAETKQTRINDDLREMLAWIVRIEGGSSAQILDPLIRPEIEARYARVKPTVDRIKAKQAEIDAEIEKAQQADPPGEDAGAVTPPPLPLPKPVRRRKA